MEKGETYKCKETVFLRGVNSHGEVCFLKGNEYTLDKDNCLTDETGDNNHLVDEDFMHNNFTLIRTPFNLELYQTGKFDVETRDGRKLSAISFTNFDGFHSIVGKINDCLYSWGINGFTNNHDCENGRDLFLAPKPEPLKEYWFNVYDGFELGCANTSLKLSEQTCREDAICRIKLTFNAQNECVAFENIKI